MLVRFLTAIVVGAFLAPSATTAAAETWTANWIFKSVPQGAVPMHASQKVWRDQERKVVIVDGEVCLREGLLEMFACPRNTKEHESVVAVDAAPSVVHAALVAVSARPGSPVRFDPYLPATGSPIKVMVVWADEQGNRRAAPAQDWIKNSKTGKAMQNNWVFGGSYSTIDETTGQRLYMADGGDFICLSNFASAAMDLPVKSSQENSDLLFEAFTDNIPPLKTRVRLVLIPQPEMPHVAADSN